MHHVYKYSFEQFALWDIKGKALGVPVHALLGGKMRDRVHVYAHAASVPAAQDLVDKGYDAIKIGGGQNCLQNVDAIRAAVGDEVDLMVDVHGPPWLTPRDAIALGKALEPYKLLFYEDPVAPVYTARSKPCKTGSDHIYLSYTPIMCRSRWTRWPRSRPMSTSP
jgi:L-alanine-DL-glutamate epimerase-like enolase superfamily enzyme